ncbi:endonuclease/exonuclease/phosphatase family protein [Estrella lausannensis]|uniref:Endonuclease/exonuclease/phosphatase domain-containing protein n=1 Tax=Estrella lausannensis TaxID=483423 RepID=A0A0H5DRV4_9BACT|nr:endonuclease/exonuclease/phosphatase family protein [Estrella lausannensis]CRX38459.1 hypothetical protein ELAC_1116 [Estrella lausannensis]
MSISVGTFNMLDPQFALNHNQKEGLTKTGQSNWPTRKQGIVKLLNESKLDVICLQEISPKSLNDIKTDLNGQYVIKYIKHAERSDGVAILYKKTFKEVNSQTLSLHGLNSGYVDLKDQLSGRVIRVANCHLLGGNKQNQGKEQIEKLLERVDTDPSKEGAIAARIITGDFNADEKQLNNPNSKFDALKKASYQFDGDLSATEIANNRHIDWIWIRGDSRLSHLDVPQPQLVSDHALLATKITFKASAMTDHVPSKVKAKPTLFQNVGRQDKATSPKTVSHAKPLQFQKPSQAKKALRPKPNRGNKAVSFGDRIKAFFGGIINFFAKLFRLRS